MSVNGESFAYKCRLLIIFANSLDPDQARQNVGPDLDPNCLTLWWYFWKFFWKKWFRWGRTDIDVPLFCMIRILTSQSTIFQLCRDRSSLVEPVFSKVKCFLLKNTMQYCRRDSNRQPLCLKSSPLLLSHWGSKVILNHPIYIIHT